MARRKKLKITDIIIIIVFLIFVNALNNANSIINIIIYLILISIAIISLSIMTRFIIYGIREYKAEKIIDNYQSELKIERKRKTYTTTYGTLDEAKWLKEKKFFINNVIIAKLGTFKPKTLHKFMNRIDSITKDFDKLEILLTEQLTPYDYEYWVAEQLQQYSWKTRVTKASGDQGIDVIATKNDIKLVIQCKKYSNAVGNDAVQQIFAGKSYENADFAAVVTNSDFTKSAISLAKSTGVMLLHHDELHILNAKCNDKLITKT